VGLNVWAELLQGLEKDLKFLAAPFEVALVQAGFRETDLRDSGG
jgi:hypothetical protein